jgi:hypothetical protein
VGTEGRIKRGKEMEANNNNVESGSGANVQGEGPQVEEPYSEEINNILLSLWDYENANGSFPPSELRAHAEHVGKLLGRIKLEREMFIYWLLQAYRSFRRQGFEDGMTDDEICNSLVHVLGNVGYDPNESPYAVMMLERPAVSYIEAAERHWALHPEAKEPRADPVELKD